MPLYKNIVSGSSGGSGANVDNILFEEFVLDYTASGIWVTNEGHHIYCGSENKAVSGSTIYETIGVHNSTEWYTGNGDVSYQVHDRTKHYFIFQYPLCDTMRGVITYDSVRDDITMTDDYKYYAIMDTDMKCWQIIKSRAREKVVGTTTGIATGGNYYGIVKIVEIGEAVATNDDGSLSTELLGATLSALTGYWSTTAGKTIYYNTWKPQ